VFEPAFPLDPGRTYFVRFDPSRPPVSRAEPAQSTTLALPGRHPGARVHVTNIYPTGDVWPENLLRFYIHFSGPMARETGVGRVHLLDDTGAEVTDALLPASVDFWSPDQTRYTVLFDPGRVKRGIRPNLELGRALTTGRTYTIGIDAAWRDAEGRPLSGTFRRTFRAGDAHESALSLDAWRVSEPAVGSRESLVVTVPDALDHALFGRTLGVASNGTPLDGVVEVSGSETEWRFTPATDWRQVPYELVVLSTLEDPAGNRIGRAFEVLPTNPASDVEPPERFSLPVRLRQG
jgi:hypothetical protein